MENENEKTKEERKLYDRISECDDMSDQEKRESYSSEMANQEAETEWQNEH